MSNVTLVLDAFNQGESQASEELLPLVYDGLRPIVRTRWYYAEYTNGMQIRLTNHRYQTL
jgi:hypothetical protein